MSEYANRDIREQGEVYVKHVSAMTGEGLHSKSDIAAELAHRDIQISQLQTEVERLRSDIEKRIEIARNNQHQYAHPHHEYYYWEGAGDALEALQDNKGDEEKDDLFFILDTLHYSQSVTCNSDADYYRQATEAHEKLNSIIFNRGYKR